MCIHNFTQVNEYQHARCILSVIKTEKHRYFYGDYVLVILWYFPVNLNNILYFHSKIVCFLLIMTVKNKVIYCFLIKGNSMYFLRWYTVLDFTVFYCCYLTVFYRNFYDFFTLLLIFTASTISFYSAHYMSPNEHIHLIHR